MTYVVMWDHRVSAGQVAEWEARSVRLFALQSRQSGFESGQLLVSLGQPNSYRLIGHWESRESYRAYQLNSAFRDFLQANPIAGQITNAQPLEAYELIHRVGGERQGDYVMFWNALVDFGYGPVAEQAEKRFFELWQQHSPVFVIGLMNRYLGDRNRYRTSVTATSLDGLRLPPAVVEFAREHPHRAYASTPVTSDPFVIVERS